MFETVAFKMLEWLTPSGIEEMSRQAAQFQSEGVQQGQEAFSGRPGHGGKPAIPASSKPRSEDELRTPLDTQDKLASQIAKAVTSEPSTDPDADNSATRKRRSHGDSVPIDWAGENQFANGVTEPTRSGDREERKRGGDMPPNNRPLHSRRSSKASVRTSSAPKPKRQLSLEGYPQEAIPEDPLSTFMKSPLLSSHNERNQRPVKTGHSTMPRPISQLTTAGYFDDVSLEKMPAPKATEVKAKLGRSQMDETRGSGSSSPKEVIASPKGLSDASSDKSQQVLEPEADLSLHSLYPQALSRLNADVVDFVCDVLQEMDMAEKHMLHPQTVTPFHTRQHGQGKALKRRKSPSRSNKSPNLRLEWRLFAEQTIFYVLSDPQLAVRSFTKKGSLYDSQTLWYCMLRLTRVAPTLVFHSLWLAAASLFAPPKPVQALRSPTAKLFPRQSESLSNEQAGWLMSICLHALVAAAPLLSDSNQLYDMSRIRSHGLSLAGSGAIARQPAEVCLQYDDAFSNSLAIRLARRLFSAITARRCFDELSQSNLGPTDTREPDILDPLFSQLDFLNMDAAYILNFSVSDRVLHETRVPTLLLDWARAVMLHDWDGNAEVPGDGPFGGALALIEAMCKYTLSRDYISGR
jgi:hypothetical protein